MSVVTIATFDNAVQANLAKTKLDSAEIFCFLTNENLVGLHTLLSNATGGIQLKVRATDVEAAIDVLALRAEDVEQTCPKCGSREIEYSVSNKDPRNWFSFIIAFLLMVFPVYIKKKFICKNCRQEF